MCHKQFSDLHFGGCISDLSAVSALFNKQLVVGMGGLAVVTVLKSSRGVFTNGVFHDKSPYGVLLVCRGLKSASTYSLRNASVLSDSPYSISNLGPK